MTSEKRDKVAKILVEATVIGDKAAADKNGISLRTLWRYRSQLKAGTDSELTASVSDKKAVIEKGWADEIPGALRSAVEFLRKAAEQADPKDPEAIHSVAGSMKLLSEVAATWKVLDARLARMAGQTREADRAGAPGSTSPVDAPGSGSGAVATH